MKHRAKSFENQSVVSLIGSALSPDEFGSVKCSHDVEEELSSAFHRLEHEVSDGPDVSIGQAAGRFRCVS